LLSQFYISLIALILHSSSTTLDISFLILTPCKKLLTHSLTQNFRINFILKFGKRDYVGDITPHANFGVYRFSGGGGFSKDTWNITLLFLFILSLPFSQFIGQTMALVTCLMAQTTCFRSRRCLLGVRMRLQISNVVCIQRQGALAKNMQIRSNGVKGQSDGTYFQILGPPLFLRNRKWLYLGHRLTNHFEIWQTHRFRTLLISCINKLTFWSFCPSEFSI